MQAVECKLWKSLTARARLAGRHQQGENFNFDGAAWQAKKTFQLSFLHVFFFCERISHTARRLFLLCSLGVSNMYVRTKSDDSGVINPSSAAETKPDNSFSAYSSVDFATPRNI
jgi:hypothetical protein